MWCPPGMSTHRNQVRIRTATTRTPSRGRPTLTRAAMSGVDVGGDDFTRTAPRRRILNTIAARVQLPEGPHHE